MSAWGLALIVLSIIWPRYGFFALGGLPQVTPFTAMAIVSWAVVPMCLVISPGLLALFIDACRQRWAIILAFAGWFAWRFIAGLFGETPGESILITARDLVYMAPLLPISLLISRVPGGVTWMTRAVLISTALVLLLAVLEQTFRRSVVELLGLNFAADAQNLKNVTEVTFRGGAIRLKSAFSHPIVFGQFLAWVAPLVAWSLLNDRSKFLRMLAIGCAVLIPWAAWSTGSRAALLGIVLSMGAFWAILSLKRTGVRSPAGILTCSVLLLGVLLTAGPGQSVLTSLVSGRNAVEASSTRYRSAMLERGMAEIAISPLVGYGDGRAAHHAGFRGRNNILTIDSLYLSSLLDSGWPGLALHLAAWGGVAAAAARSAFSPSGSSLDAGIAAGILALLATFGIVSISDNLTLLLLSLGLCVRTPWQSSVGADEIAQEPHGGGADGEG